MCHVLHGLWRTGTTVYVAATMMPPETEVGNQVPSISHIELCKWNALPMTHTMPCALQYAAACLLLARLLEVMHDLMLWFSLWSKSFDLLS